MAGCASTCAISLTGCTVTGKATSEERGKRGKIGGGEREKKEKQALAATVYSSFYSFTIIIST